jgi:polar amino acid transport system substrate-binding protein
MRIVPSRTSVSIGLLGSCLVVASCGSGTAGSAPSDNASTDCVPVEQSALIKPGTLQIGINATLPPMAYRDDSGEYAGERVELGKAVAQALCVEPEWTNAPATAMIPSLDAKRIDVINIGYFITPERTKVMQMIATEQQGVSVVVAKGNPAGVKSVEDLAGKNVATSVGSFEESTIKAIDKEQQAKGMKPMNIQSFANYDLVFQSLVAGQVDAVVTTDPTAKYYADKQGFTLVASGLALTPTSLTVRAGNDALASAVVKALDLLRKKGFYDELMKKYNLTPVKEFKVQWTG